MDNGHLTTAELLISERGNSVMHKPLEYWAALVGMVIYVAMRDAERESIKKRVGKTAASAFLTVGLSPSVAPYVRGSEVLAAVVIMSLGLIVLDVATAVVADRDFIKELIRNRIGGGDGNA